MKLWSLLSAFALSCCLGVSAVAQAPSRQVDITVEKVTGTNNFLYTFKFWGAACIYEEAPYKTITVLDTTMSNMTVTATDTYSPIVVTQPAAPDVEIPAIFNWPETPLPIVLPEPLPFPEWNPSIFGPDNNLLDCSAYANWLQNEANRLAAFFTRRHCGIVVENYLQNYVPQNAVLWIPPSPAEIQYEIKKSRVTILDEGVMYAKDVVYLVTPTIPPVTIPPVPSPRTITDWLYYQIPNWIPYIAWPTGPIAIPLSSFINNHDAYLRTANTTGISDVTWDGIIDADDFIAFVNSYSASDIASDPLADVNGDQIIDADDFVAFINSYGCGC